MKDNGMEIKRKNNKAIFCEFPILEGDIVLDDVTGVPSMVSHKGDIVEIELNSITTIDTDYDDGETIVKTTMHRRPIKIDMTFDEAVERYNLANDNVKGCVFYRNRVDKTGGPQYSPVMIPNVRIGTIDVSYTDNDTILVKTDDGRVAIAESFEEAVEEFNRVSQWNLGCVFNRASNGNPVMVPSARIKDIRESRIDGSTIVYTFNGKLAVEETVSKAKEILDQVAKK